MPKTRKRVYFNTIPFDPGERIRCVCTSAQRSFDLLCRPLSPLSSAAGICFRLTVSPRCVERKKRTHHLGNAVRFGMPRVYLV